MTKPTFKRRSVAVASSVIAVLCIGMTADALAAKKRKKRRRRGPPARVEGRVIEKGTAEPLAGALVVLPRRATETYTDGEGRFSFDRVRPGRTRLYVPGTDHKPIRRRIVLRPGRLTRIVVRPERRSYVLYRASASAPPPPAVVTAKRLTNAEITRIPGANGDSFKVVQSLPGVSRPAGGSGQIIVRGSSPQDSQAVIEGVQIPQLYHFGGIYSVLNTDLLEGIQFSPSGYAVRFGRRNGGLIESQLRIPRQRERWKGYIEANAFHAGFLLRGPLGDNTNIAVAARRSYIDAILAALPDDLLPLTLAPRYYDGQLKIDHRFNDRWSGTLMLFGSDDELRAVVSEPPAAFPDARGDISTGITFGGAIATLRYEGKELRYRSTMAFVPNKIGTSIGDALSFDLNNAEVTIRQEIEYGTRETKVRAGIDWLWNGYDISLRLPATQQTGERGGAQSSFANPEAVAQDGVFYYPSLWVDSVIKPLKGLEVVAGARLDFFRQYIDDASGRERRRIDNTVTPRVNARYALTKKLTLKAAAGTTSQAPLPQQLADAPFGNPLLRTQRSFETTVGAEMRITDAIDLDVQLFDKQLWNLVVPGKTFGGPLYSNEGTGQVLGAEILLRHRPVKQFFGWIGYTIQRATRTDRPGEPERLFGWDQTHIFTALGSYKLPANWEVGLRWRYVTGTPYTDVVGAIWNDDNDTWQRTQSGCINCVRVPAFHQLDVRIDKKFVFDKWLLGVYLDVQNAYNRANPESIAYSYDATQRSVNSGLPIIPSFGIRGEF